MERNVMPPLLVEALDSHGGLDRWRGFKRLSSTIVTGGALWPLKGIDLPPIARTVTTDLNRQWAAFIPFMADGSTLTWTPERVVIQQASDIVAERYEPRKAFAGHWLETPWDLLHLAYFQGYAMWTYHALPFLLAEPGLEIAEIPEIVDDGVSLRGLNARFPEAIETHSIDQQFYFTGDGLLRRHDYEVDIAGRIPAAHYLEDYVDIGGFRLPTRRTVYPRRADGSVDRTLETVTVSLSDYQLT